MINTRNQITNLLKQDIIGCELGVFEGAFSKILIDSNKFSKLYLVDTFDGEASNFGKAYRDASILEKYVNNRFTNDYRIEVIKNDSISFLKSMPANYFDFIYIDTVHSYDLTIKELNESHRVVKNNGLISGHDFNVKEFPGVCKAVNEFCLAKNIKYTITNQDYYESYIINLIK